MTAIAIITLAILVWWVLCGVVAAGWIRAFFLRRYGDVDGPASALVMIVGGFSSLLVAVCTRSSSGLRWTSYGWLKPWRKHDD